MIASTYLFATCTACDCETTCSPVLVAMANGSLPLSLRRSVHLPLQVLLRGSLHPLLCSALHSLPRPVPRPLLRPLHPLLRPIHPLLHPLHPLRRPSIHPLLDGLFFFHSLAHSTTTTSPAAPFLQTGLLDCVRKTLPSGVSTSLATCT